MLSNHGRASSGSALVPDRDLPRRGTGRKRQTSRRSNDAHNARAVGRSRTEGHPRARALARRRPAERRPQGPRPPGGSPTAHGRHLVRRLGPRPPLRPASRGTHSPSIRTVPCGSTARRAYLERAGAEAQTDGLTPCSSSPPPSATRAGSAASWRCPRGRRGRLHQRRDGRHGLRLHRALRLAQRRGEGFGGDAT